jgi:hypothetical protein
MFAVVSNTAAPFKSGADDWTGADILSAVDGSSSGYGGFHLYVVSGLSRTCEVRLKADTTSW